MLKFNNIRIRPKLLLLFTLTGIIPLLIVSLIYTRLATEALLEKSFNQLSTVQDIRKEQIENYFQASRSHLEVLAESERVRQLLETLNAFGKIQQIGEKEGFPANLAMQQPRVSQHAQSLKKFADAYDYHDLLLLDAEHGHVMFSTALAEDLGSNINHGKFRDSGLGNAWRRTTVTRKPTIIDFAPYLPGNGEECAFFSQPVKAVNGDLLGVLAIRLTPVIISKIIDSRKGMGESGESYLMGYSSLEERYEFRSNLVTMGDGKYVVGATLGELVQYWPDAVKAADSGGSGIYTDSAGNLVLVAFNRLDLPGLDWFLVSKIDKGEVTAPIRTIITRLFMVAIGSIFLIILISIFFSRTITQPLLADMKFAKAISDGELDVILEMEQKDELGDLARTLNTMAETLRDMNWLKSGKEGLDDVLRGEFSLQELSERCITHYVRHLGAQLGAIYLRQGENLELKASYAFTDPKGLYTSYQVGEGMVGQAARDGETLVFKDLGNNVPKINFGAGEALPQTFLVVPIYTEVKNIGVLLLGFNGEVEELQQKFINQNIGNTAILYSAAASRERIQELLTTSKQQQQQLHLANKELEDQTRALEKQKDAFHQKNVELVKSQQIVKEKARDLELSNKYKSEFLANMSHELRTPLNSILILSQLLAENSAGNLNDKQTESAATIYSSGSALLKLINEILDLSKIEAGKVELHVDKITPQQLVDDLQRLYQGIAADKNIDLQVRIEEDTPATLTTDNQRLQQVLRNLLTNAFKFTSKGVVTLTIGRPTSAMLSGTALQHEEAVSFAVKDEGIGIPADKQSAIFEAFRQAEGGTSRKYGGTGLGLSISRELTRLLGGTIHLSSSEGQGSIFTVVVPETFPADIERMSQPPTTTGTSATVLPTYPSTVECIPQGSLQSEKNTANLVEDDRKDITSESKSLMIIEDDPDFAKVLRDLGRQHGFMCIVADSGETGLHFAGYYQPSAIILDIGLPGIDGWTVMQRLKEDPELRHIPVHFISAKDSSLDAMHMGAVGFLTKPVSRDKIEEAFIRFEDIISRPLRNLLLVGDDNAQQESIRRLIGNGDVEITTAATADEAYTELEDCNYDCMIIDLDFCEMSDFDLLKRIRVSEPCSQIPVIIYSGRDLTRSEEHALSSYAESIVVKGVTSPERLLDETLLFLHRIEANLPKEQREMLKTVHDKQSILSGKTILLVDDDMRNVFALSSVLEASKINVLIARDGVECLEKLEQHGTDIQAVLMDIMMPRLDGYETMQKIRQDSDYAKLPIIALTAKAMKGDRAKCIEAGANDYLAKPVNTDKLLSMLRVWLY